MLWQCEDSNLRIYNEVVTVHIDFSLQTPYHPTLENNREKFNQLQWATVVVDFMFKFSHKLPFVKIAHYFAHKSELLCISHIILPLNITQASFIIIHHKRPLAAVFVLSAQRFLRQRIEFTRARKIWKI